MNREDRPKSDYLDIIQVFRGIAALMVVAHHAIGSLRFYHKMDYPLFSFVASAGKYGVDFFFVLSGFIITYSAHHHYNRTGAFGRYIKNRLVRIYVPYLPVGILMLVLYTCLPQFSNADRNISAITSLTLFPHGNPALSVAWTLSFELCFYLLFGISFVSRNAWNWFVMCWFALIVAANYTRPGSIGMLHNPVLKVFFSAYNIEFILGYVLAWLILSKKKISPIPVSVLLILSLTAFVYCTASKTAFFYFSTHYLFAAAAFSVIYLAATCRPAIKKESVMMLIGNATYSVYLLHNPLQMAVIRFFPKINTVGGYVFALLLVLVIASFTGYLYYLFFEKAAIRKIKAHI